MMDISYTESERAFQKEAASYLRSIMSPELVKDFSTSTFGRDVYRSVLAQVGRDGWLVRGWPRGFGGQDGSAIEQYIFYNEARKASLPLPYLTINSVAPAIMRYGSAEQKAELLPRIARGDVVFGIGYSEPDAGTDLAALSTSAKRDGEDYVINGQKTWTSLAHLADYIWLAARTSRTTKHEGISMILVPTTAAGVLITPIETIGDYRTNAIYFDDVRVPLSSRVGEEGQGWNIIRSQLDFERVALSNPGYIEAQLREVHRWARETVRADGSRPIDEARVRTGIAKAYAIHEALKLLNWKLAAAIQTDQVTAENASTVKVYGTERSLDAYQLLMDVLGEDGYVKSLSGAAVIRTDLEKAYRRDLTFTFGGGANEVQRQIIARQRIAATTGDG